MKYSREQILKKAEQVLKDLDEDYYCRGIVDEIIFMENKQMDFPVAAVANAWNIYIHALFSKLDILVISDETGEPVYYQNFNYIKRAIGKKEDGTYYRIR